MMDRMYNFAILVGTAYIVFWKEGSPWWFALATFLILVSSTVETRKNENPDSKDTD